jgi:hypothetical protein
MYKACSKCGKIHDYNQPCPIKRITYNGGQERKLRSTNRWTEKSKEIRAAAHYMCEVCRDQNKIEYNNIEVHHIVKVRDDETLLLDNYNLICLCQEHHEQADKGLIDKEYLKRLARQREESG